MSDSQFDIAVFDLDGTLIDSKGDIASSLNWTLTQLDLDPIPLAVIESFVGNGIQPLITKSVIAAGSPEREEAALALFRDRYWECLLDTTETFPGVIDTIIKLQNRIQMAVVSNKMERYTVKILEGLNMAKYFGGLVYGGDTLPVKKPDPAALLDIASKLGASTERMVIVGDSAVDIEAGKRAGAATIGVTYGYRDADEILHAAPDLIIDRFDRLLEVL